MRRCDLCSAHDSVLLATKRGVSLRFATDEKQLRGSGRLSRGVRSIALRDGDEVARARPNPNPTPTPKPNPKPKPEPEPNPGQVADMSVVVNSSSAARAAIYADSGGVGPAPSGAPEHTSRCCQP